jgi:ribose transport system substrate-binding protein
MKKIILFALSLFVYMFLQSCGETEKPADPNKDNYKFLYIALDTTGNSKLIEYGLEKAKADFPNVTFTAKYPTQSANVQEQIAFVQEALTEGYGGIIIVPASDSLLTDDFTEALKKHVPVVIIENPTKYSDYVAKIATDNNKTGRAYADYLLTIYNNTGKIAILSDDAKNKNNASRIDGFVGKIGASNFQGSFVSPNIYHANNYQSAKTKITTIINNNPSLAVIYATNGIGTLAASDALRAKNKTDVIVLGYDNNPDNVNLLTNGDIKALCVTSPVTMGYSAIQQLINYKKGLSVTKIITPPTWIITKENINSTDSQNALYPKGK